MQLTQREEILVVCDYEMVSQVGFILYAIQERRKSIGDKRPLTVGDLNRMLFDMVEYDNLLEAWIRPSKKKLLIRLAELSGWRAKDPLCVYYRLTPAGWRAERDLEDRLFRENFIDSTKGGKGRSK